MRECGYRECSAMFKPARGVRYCSQECREAERTIRSRGYWREYSRRNKARRDSYARDWRLRNPDRAFVHRLTAYGLTLDDYRTMFERQESSCGICGGVDPGHKDWHIDHDHSCCPAGRSCGACVRGLLCFKCNVGLGAFRDNPEVLRSAISYLLAAVE